VFDLWVGVGGKDSKVLRPLELEEVLAIGFDWSIGGSAIGKAIGRHERKREAGRVGGGGLGWGVWRPGRADACLT
jgi:hypothetical protein